MTDIESKVRQIDADVRFIYESLNRIEARQTRQGNRLDQVEESLATVHTKLDQILEILKP
jgi:hypothetical protein